MPATIRCTRSPSLLSDSSLSASKIRFTNIDPAGSPPALITGQVAAIAGYAQGYVPSVEIRGNKKARVLWYADCGVTAVSNGISYRSHQGRSRDHPVLCRCEPQRLPLRACASR